MKKQKCIILLLAITGLNHMAMAQKYSDSALATMPKIEQANYYMQKSRTGKAIGYGVLAAGMGIFALSISASNNDNSSADGLALLGTLTMAASNPILCAASRNKGRADMLLRIPGPNEGPEYTRALTTKYRQQATAYSIAGWVLFLGGFTGLFVAANQSSDALAIASFASMFASLPVWMNAARNKGRASILMRTENIHNSYLPGSSLYRSIGVSIALGGVKHN